MPCRLLRVPAHADPGLSLCLKWLSPCHSCPGLWAVSGDHPRCLRKRQGVCRSSGGSIAEKSGDLISSLKLTIVCSMYHHLCCSSQFSQLIQVMRLLSFEHSSYLEAIVSGFYPHFVHSSFSALFSLVKKIHLSSIVNYDILKIDLAPNLKQIFKKVTFFMRQSITYHYITLG